MTGGEVNRLAVPRWIAGLAGVAALGLVPWVVFLAIELPEQSEVTHYDLGWVGFDIALIVVLASVAAFAVRGSSWVVPLAVVATTMLVVDAWFDIVTAPDPSDRTVAVASALLFELPLAVVCGWVAISLELARRRVSG